MKNRYIGAAVAGLIAGTLLALLIVLVFPGTAHATDTNHPEYWQDTPGEVCTNVGYETEDSAGHPYVLPNPEDGFVYSKVIVKAGSTGHSVTDENAVYTTGLIAGSTYVHPEKGSISHVIVCTVPAEVPTPEPTPEPTLPPELPTPPPLPELAETGSESGVYLVAGALLLILGGIWALSTDRRK